MWSIRDLARLADNRVVSIDAPLPTTKHSEAICRMPQSAIKMSLENSSQPGTAGRVGQSRRPKQTRQIAHSQSYILYRSFGLNCQNASVSDRDSSISLKSPSTRPTLLPVKKSPYLQVQPDCFSSIHNTPLTLKMSMQRSTAQALKQALRATAPKAAGRQVAKRSYSLLARQGSAAMPTRIGVSCPFLEVQAVR